jgi:hypothetical protein
MRDYARVGRPLSLGDGGKDIRPIRIESSLFGTKLTM